jgi:hypothetical protein
VGASFVLELFGSFCFKTKRTKGEIYLYYLEEPHCVTTQNLSPRYSQNSLHHRTIV